MGTIKYVTENGKVHTSIYTAYQEKENITGGTSKGTIRYITSNGNVYTEKETAIAEERLIDIKGAIFNPGELHYWSRMIGAHRLDDLLKKIVYNRDDVIESLSREY